MKTLIRLFRQNLLTGFLALTPIVVTAWILGRLFDWTWRFYQILPETLRIDPGTGPWRMVFNLLSILGVLIALLTVISFLGWISRQYLGKKLLQIVGQILQRIPIIGTIYGALDQLLRTFSSDNQKQFSRVVWVEFPRKDSWTIGFVTSAAPSRDLGKGFLNIFVPATPNPTSGFLICVPEKDVKETNLTVEQAFKLILSLGLAQSP